MLTEKKEKVTYIYYVCNEFGDVVYEFYDELDAMTEANKYIGFSVSRKQLLTED